MKTWLSIVVNIVWEICWLFDVAWNAEELDLIIAIVENVGNTEGDLQGHKQNNRNTKKATRAN